MKQKSLIILCLVFLQAPAFIQAATPGSSDTRQEKARARIEALFDGPSEKEALEILRELGGYPFPFVAKALLKFVRAHLDDPALLQEAEWALVSIGPKIVEPLSEALTNHPEMRPVSLVLLSRVARHYPSAVTPLLQADTMALRELGVLALWGTGSMEARSEILKSFNSMVPSLQATTVDVVCARKSKVCVRVVSAALQMSDVGVLRHALGAATRRNARSTRRRVAGLLHHADQEVARAALETLETLGGDGVEGELSVYFESAKDPARMKVLRILATVHTPEALKFLAGVTRRFSARSDVGRDAHKIRREGVGRIVAPKDSKLSQVPEEAVLMSDAKGKCRLILYNDLGYRVVQSGMLVLQERRGNKQRPVSQDQFSQDGSLALPFRCDGDDRLPSMRWTRKTSGSLHVVIEENH